MAAEPGIEQELEELCTLACLYLDHAEKEQIARQLNSSIKVLRQVQEIDTTGVEPAVHPAALQLRLREDEVEPSLRPDLVFGNTGNRREQYFYVPRIAEDALDEA